MPNRRLALALLLVAASLASDGIAQSASASPQSERAALAQRANEVETLRKRAEAATAKLAELTASGKIALNDDTIALMRELVQTLAEINERLKRVESEVRELGARLGERDQAAKQTSKDLAELRRFKNASYFQFQYRSSNEPGREADAFAFRRTRIGTQVTLDERSAFKLSFDLSAGGTGTAAQLRDAFLTLRLSPLAFAQVGQAPLPLGYDLERSSSQREFPERARYNGVLFNGERDRGVNLKATVGRGWKLQYGLWDALTHTDPEQANLAAGPRGRLAHTAGVRYAAAHGEVGVSALLGSRPSFTGGGKTSPETERRFVYLDGAIGLGKLAARAEAMVGRDRVPSATGDPAAIGKNLTGWQLQVSYDVTPTGRLSARAEAFDPDRDRPGDAIEGIGLAYAHELGERTKITVAWEQFRDPARGGPYRVLTLRTQVRF